MEASVPQRSPFALPNFDRTLRAASDRAMRICAPLVALALIGAMGACCPSAGAQSYAALDTTGSRARAQGAARGGGRGSRYGLPNGREIAQLSWRECRRILERSKVSYEAVPDDAAPRVHAPVYVFSPLSGVSFSPTNGIGEQGMLDCRLAVALLAWAPILQRNGVVKVEHYSTYRRGAHVARSSKMSGHARALAIDAARFHLEDGRVLDVVEDWDERERGGDPCGERRREDAGGKLLRRVVCEAVEQSLFQVVITPHHDRAHQNHVHLELVPNVDWTYVR
jgi:hypothetical protein